MDERVFRIEIDSHDRICFVNQEWKDFASENNGNALLQNSPIGLPIYSFVCDRETKHLYRTLIDKARKNGRSYAVPFRCDSPTCRRFMQLEIIPLDNGQVRLDSRVLREEERAEVRLLLSDTPRSDELLHMCCYCKRIEIEGDWAEVEKAIERLDLFASPTLPGITHSICPDCYADVWNLMQE